MLLVTLACIPFTFAQSNEKAAVAANAAAPVLVSRIEPEYTAEARSKGVEGVTTLYAEVTSEGSAANIRVIKSLDPGLDARAIAALKQWRFRPGSRNGRPVTMVAIIEVNFRLPKHPPVEIELPQPQTLPSGDWRSLLQLLEMSPIW
jgi:TonB family protein